MTAHILDGRRQAEALRAGLAEEIAALAKHGMKPGLAVIMVGEDPASQVYVRNKTHQTQEVGMASFAHHLPVTVSQGELLALIDRLNRDETVDGILVQLPLPAGIDAALVIAAIAPDKDVDGFHPLNVGRLAAGLEGLVPCTPLGCVMLLRSLKVSLAGQEAVIVGRSNIVGKPLAHLLLRENCTVTLAHSQSRDLPALCRRADILIAAVGRPELVRGNWIKPGAIVIDVGINRVQTGDRTRLVGDVAFTEGMEVASAITPVPGGVGPMTIACLLHNTVQAFRSRRMIRL
jgi:methylenetetrahydrofolate dehydrogenase (NADP+) / methenyltetrahydrofolate cyclohydrolase